jgi:DDE superfamily endonuclease
MGTHVMSTDEKTGMQALERLHATKPGRPGLVERVEFEYVRHGTLSLIANFDVATGKVVSPSIGPTRTEADFVAHIDRTIEADPEAGWIFVTDQLDTHRAATLVGSLLAGAVSRMTWAPRARPASSNRSRLAGSSWRTRPTGFASSTRLATARG